MMSSMASGPGSLVTVPWPLSSPSEKSFEALSVISQFLHITPSTMRPSAMCVHPSF